MILNSAENIEKAQKIVEKMNGKMIQRFIHENNQRHVKEENEPLLDGFIDNFHNIYGTVVVGQSMKEIVKLIKE